jgi:phytanoyl-CoA hydroxylase
MLDQVQVNDFARNGFLIMPGLLADEDLAELRACADRLQADALARLAQPGYLDDANRINADWIEHPVDHFVYREKPDRAIAFHRVERGFTQDPVIAEMAVHPLLLTHAWQILQRPFWPRAGNIVYKLPYEGAAVRWHQDVPYLFWSFGGHPSKGRPATHPIPNFTTDVYLDPSSETNGCLYALPGSHCNGTVDVDALVPGPGQNPPGAVPLELNAGDVMFHHVALVHGSQENRSPARRRTVYYHYLTDETVQDAYSDWPDLLSAVENMAFWSEALRRGARKHPALPEGALAFSATPQGLRPRPGA